MTVREVVKPIDVNVNKLGYYVILTVIIQQLVTINNYVSNCIYLVPVWKEL